MAEYVQDNLVDVSCAGQLVIREDFCGVSVPTHPWYMCGPNLVAQMGPGHEKQRKEGKENPTSVENGPKCPGKTAATGSSITLAVLVRFG